MSHPFCVFPSLLGNIFLNFNAVLKRLVAQVKISLLLKIQWQKSYNLCASFAYKFCLQAGKEVERKIGIG
jgi:hypothetical protein